MPAYFIVVVIAILTCMGDGVAWAQAVGAAGDAQRRPSGASGLIVCDGRMGCAPLRPGCRLVRGGGSFDTIIACGSEKAGMRAPQRSMRGSEN
jgi:hypothetical protein